MGENALKPKPKENFLKRIWKSATEFILKPIFLRKPKYKKYVDLPEHIKSKYDVKIAVLRYEIEKNESGKYMMYSDASIRFTTEEILRVLEDVNKELFDYLSWERKNAVIEKDDSYLEMCKTEDKLKFIQSHPDKIKKLDEDLQFELLTQEHDKPGQDALRNELGASKIKPEDYSNKLDQFSIAVVKRVIKHYLEEEAKEKAGNKYAKNNAFLEQIKIDNLPVEVQLEIANLDTRFVKLMSDEAAKMYVADNPMLVNYLSLEMKKQMIAERIELLVFLNKRNHDELKEILTFLSQQPGIQVPDEYKITHSKIFENDEPVTNVEPFKRLITQGHVPILLGDGITKSLEIIPELAIFAPDRIGNVFHFEKSIETKKKMIDEFKRKIKENSQLDLEEIDQTLDSLTVNNRDDFGELKCGNLLKVLLNERVLTRVPKEQILKFAEDPFDRDVLLEIVELAYGEKAKQQLEKHPEITIKEIVTLDIFDPIILEKFGEGTVSNMLVYDSLGVMVLGDLARHPEEMEKFEAFKNLFDEKTEDITDLNNKLIMFGEFKELFANIDLNSLTQQQKDTVILIYHDYFMMKNSRQNSFMKVVSLEDIDSYEERRSQILKDYLEKSTDVSAVKNAIAVRFFGMQYNEYENTGENGRQNKEKLDLVGMVEYYNLDRFLTDDRTVHSDLFTEQELDMLEIVRIVKGIDDPIVLKKLYEKLESRTDVLRPVDFSKTKAKIPLQYSRELVSSLLTVEKAKEMAEREDGITYKNEDGYDIIGLEGANFNLMMVSDNGANSKCGGQIVGEFINHNSLAHQFKIKYGAYKLAYMNIPEGQVVTMGNFIDTRQGRKSLEEIQEMRYAKFNYPDQTIATSEEMRAENRRTRVRMPGTHIFEGEPEYGEKINLEMAIVVNGDVTDEIKGIAMQNGKDGKPAPIIKVNYSKYNARHRSTFEHKSVQREDSDLITSVKELLEPDGDERD